MDIQDRLTAAWLEQTAADLAQVFEIHHGMTGAEAAQAVQCLEDDGLIEINVSREDGPYTFTSAGLAALGI